MSVMFCACGDDVRNGVVSFVKADSRFVNST